MAEKTMKSKTINKAAKKEKKVDPPKQESLIIGQKETEDLLRVAVTHDLPALLVGETGTGKTSLVRELAATDGKVYTRFSITGETTVDDFVGKYVLKNGETIWQDGILLTAVKGGHYLVVDEINAALPEILFVLHSLLDDDKYVIVPQKDNSLVKPHASFRFFATMNPVDEYAGTKELNKAFMSRFAMVLEVKYPNRKTEVEIVTSRTGVDISTANKMVDVAIGIRRAKSTDKIFYTFSTRDLIYWGKLVEPLGIHRAFRVAIKNKGMGDGQQLEGLYNAVFTEYAKFEDSIGRVETFLEEINREKKDIETTKLNIRAAVEKDVKADLDKDFQRLGTEKAKNAEEKRVLQQMEVKLKEQIRKGLKDLA
jgi:MoxR-like ATPase